ncbi:MAG: RagB/SusD family nutrient uptake outer membrane protein [Bacteroidetes bacterium]|nr:RagB/SusD family nutrient uptake outer membrane protein [Bacteroidota bacterium]
MFLLISLLILSCKKQLEVKPDAKLVTPQKLSDLQALLDYDPYMVQDMGMDESSADNYYLTDDDYDGMNETDQRIYSWQKDNLFSGPNCDWGRGYRRVYYANTVLDFLPQITQTAANTTSWNDVKGQALFVRGTSFFKLVNGWSPAYDVTDEGTGLGIPLRLTADFNEKSVRSTVHQCYDRILADLKGAAGLLPVQNILKTRPSKASAWAYLSRVFIAMHQYENALKYADSAILISGALMDFNSLNVADNFPIPRFNVETIFYNFSGAALIDPYYVKIDSVLYNSYDNNDLRKQVYFTSLPNNRIGFKGSYSNYEGEFSGIATDEVYLNRAECYARAGNMTGALNDLNTLLAKRYKTGTFVPLTASTTSAVLSLVLQERRKELVMRFTRWMDIKRLNKEGASITIRRLVHGQQYNLFPNDLRYSLPIPEDVIALSGMQQNPR